MAEMVETEGAEGLFAQDVLRLPLPHRVLCVLRAEGLVTVGDVVRAAGKGRFARRIRNFGRCSRIALYGTLVRLGVDLPPKLLLRESQPEVPATFVLAPEWDRLRRLLLERGYDLSRPFDELPAVGRVLSANVCTRLRNQQVFSLGDLLTWLERTPWQSATWVDWVRAALRDLSACDAAPFAAPGSLQELASLALGWPGLSDRQREILVRHFERGEQLTSLARAMDMDRRNAFMLLREALARLRSLRPDALRLTGAVLEAAEAQGGILHRSDAVELAQEPGLPLIALGLALCGLRYSWLGDQFIYRQRPQRLGCEEVRLLLREQPRVMPLRDLAPIIQQATGFLLQGQALRCFAERVLHLTVSGEMVRRLPDVPLGPTALLVEYLRQAGGPVSGEALRSRWIAAGGADADVTRICHQLSQARAAYRVGPHALAHEDWLPLSAGQREAVQDFCVQRLRRRKGAVPVERLLHALQRAGQCPPGLNQHLLKSILMRHPEVKSAGRLAVAAGSRTPRRRSET